MFRHALVLFLIVLIATPAVRAAESRETPPAFRQFLETFNRGAIKNPRLARWRALYGPLAVQFVTTTPAGTTVWTRGNETDAWLGFVLRDDPDDPIVLSLAGAPPRDDLHERRQRSREEARAAMAGYMSRQAAADRFSGVVLVVSEGRVLFRGAYGKHIGFDTQFSIASVGKIFTAVSIAQLIDLGAIGYDDHVSRFLPEFRNAQSDPTVRQLLTHTSGLAHVPQWMRANHAQRLSDITSAVARAKPEFAPGKDVRYSNEAWVVLGAIVERVSGLSYEHYLQRHVFTPLRMTSTGFWSFNEAKNVATPRTLWRPAGDDEEEFAGGARVSATRFLRYRGSPAGGAISTAADLDRFLGAFWNGKLASPETVAAFTAEQIPNQSLEPPPPDFPKRPGFGYGFEVDGSTGRVSKMGGALGVSAYVSVLPRTGTRIVVLSNYDSIAPIVGMRLEELAWRAAR